jgi:hypothetical protein
MGPLPYVYPVEIVGLVVAPKQRYVGRPGHDVVVMPDEDRRTTIACSPAGHRGRPLLR